MDLQDVLFDWRREIEQRLQVQFAQLHSDVVSMLTERVQALEVKLETEKEMCESGRGCKSEAFQDLQLPDVEKELQAGVHHLQSDASFGAPPSLGALGLFGSASVEPDENFGNPSGNSTTRRHNNAESGAPGTSIFTRWPFAARAGSQTSRTPVFSRDAKKESHDVEEDVNQHGPRRERYSKLSDLDKEPEVQFDRLKGDVIQKIVVEAPAHCYNLFDNTIANLLARRSQCPVWGQLLALKASGDVEGVFAQLDGKACFARGCEWRGIMGETVWHICFLLMGDVNDGMQTCFGKLAELIYKRSPHFIDLPYSAGFYQGETAMHLAIAHRDIGSVRWLLARSADLEQYATGHFFHQFLWGEHPLAWAACGDKMLIMKELLEARANCRFRDSQGNSVLHNMAMSPILTDGAKFSNLLQVLKTHDAGITELFKWENDDHRTPLQVASSSEGGNVEAVLHATSETSWVFGGVACTKHPLHGWDSAHDLDKGREDLSALEVALLAGNGKFFCVPVNQLMLEAKWKLFIRHRVILKAVYFVIFASASTAGFCLSDVFWAPLDMIIRTFAFSLGLALLLFNCCTFLTLRRTKFWKLSQSWASRAMLMEVHKSIAAMNVLLSFSIEWWLQSTEHNDFHQRMARLLNYTLRPTALLMIWTCMAEVLFIYEYTCMILIIGKALFTVELPVYVFLQGLMLVGFSAAIYGTTALSRAAKDPRLAEFGSFHETLMWLAMVPLGQEIEVMDFMEAGNTALFILYFCYSSLSCILFLNLTISLFTERTLKIWSNSHPYYYSVLGFQCVAEEKRMRAQDLNDIRVGTKFGDGRHYLLVQKFPKVWEDHSRKASALNRPSLKFE